MNWNAFSKANTMHSNRNRVITFDSHFSENCSIVTRKLLHAIYYSNLYTGENREAISGPVRR